MHYCQWAWKGVSAGKLCWVRWDIYQWRRLDLNVILKSNESRYVWMSHVTDGWVRTEWCESWQSHVRHILWLTAESCETHTTLSHVRHIPTTSTRWKCNNKMQRVTSLVNESGLSGVMHCKVTETYTEWLTAESCETHTAKSRETYTNAVDWTKI